MSLKYLLIVFLLAGLGFAGTAAATEPGFHSYSLAKKSGGQIQIGGGLPLPIQATCNAVCTGTKFPPLLVERAPGATVQQTNIRLTGKKMIVPKGVLRRAAAVPAPLILGQADNNPALYAAATNITWTWPETTRTFSTARRTGNTTTTFNAGSGRTIRYSNSLGRKFGGPANFALYLGAPGPVGGAGPPGDLKANAAATLYIIAVQPTGQPPCAHTAFGGANPACVGLIINLQPTGGSTAGGTLSSRGLAAPGGGSGVGPLYTTGPLVPFTVTTPGGTPIQVAQGGPRPGIGIVKAGATPRGTISLFAWTGGNATGLINQASSSGFPWTTGKITVKATGAGGGGESWKITGKDLRDSRGNGTIQMVSGALSTRTVTGDNANRGWIRLVLYEAEALPTMSPVGLASTAVLMLLAAGYMLRRKLFT